ncbi:protein chibby homolog 1-like [Hyalella azteca]|uniref:Protein chibby homolog 1-like n=1 Tax=Hyalella azteca TaxID=294128 RepID=A0A8B7PAI7_HYAAZ|nr:protein chibby homolog 1-like [Hyalella azteca]
MPLRWFGRSFSPGKGPPQRSSSLSALNRSPAQLPATLAQDYNRIDMRLSKDQLATFEDGTWRLSGRGDVADRIVHRADQKLLDTIEKLQAENRELKLKTELLLDMLTEKSAEHQIAEQALKKLQAKTRS